MTSNRPYRIRAFYEWIAEDDKTPYILVDAEYSGVVVPKEHIRDGKIVLNISMVAVDKLVLGNETLEFDARFSGVVWHIYVPINAVVAIYARETGRGIAFLEKEDSGFQITPPGPGKTESRRSAKALPKSEDKTQADPKKKGPPHLRVVE